MGIRYYYRRSSQANIDRVTQDLEYACEDFFRKESEECIDIDKTWAAIQFVLGKIVRSGDVLGQPFEGGHVLHEEGGIVIAWLSPAEVAVVAKGLSLISDAVFSTAYDSSKMGLVYPEIWTGGLDHDEAFEYLLSHFRSLRDFYFLAASTTQAVGVMRI